MRHGRRLSLSFLPLPSLRSGARSSAGVGGQVDSENCVYTESGVSESESVKNRCSSLLGASIYDVRSGGGGGMYWKSRQSGL